ncbi:DUF2961 domain-containing protein [bacterium]|nr:DUF2961 domain-containing protein [bacterium]
MRRSIAASLFLFATVAAQADSVTTESLLKEMVRLDRWSRLADPPYQMVIRTWGNDAGKSSAGKVGRPALPAIQQKGRTEYVLFDEAGPGTLARLLLPRVPTGVLRVYLDDLSKPTLEGTLDDLAAGGVAPFGPAFILNLDEQVDVEFPIPFALQGRVTLEVDDPAQTDEWVYQVSSRLYDSTTPVETFTPANFERIKPTLTRVENVLLGREPQEPTGAWDLRFPISLSASHPSAEIQLPKGTGGMIGELHLKVSASDPARLRESILAISFDGRTTVRVPVVEFFATMAGGGSYRSLASEVTADGEYIIRCPMPFVERAEIALEGPGSSQPVTLKDAPREKKGPLRRLLKPRESKRPIPSIEPLVGAPPDVSVEGYALVGPYNWDARSVYFHACWQQETSGGKEKNLGLQQRLSGRGTYVGSSLCVSSPTSATWGTAREEIVVDSQEPSSLPGAELADFFGVKDQPTERLLHGLRGLTRIDGPGFFGHSSFVRWRTLDAVPFSNSLRFDWLTQSVAPGVCLGTVHYWYEDAWSAAPQSRLQQVDVALPTLPPRDIPKIDGAVEGESLAVIRALGNKPTLENRIHEEHAGPWSQDADLVWHGIAPGNELVLAFDAPRAGKYRVMAYFSKGVDYGIHRVAVNDQSAGDPIDFFHIEPLRMPPYDLGEFELRPTGNRLQVRVVSTSKSASPKSCTFGLDALTLTPVGAGPNGPLSAAPPAVP